VGDLTIHFRIDEKPYKTLLIHEAGTIVMYVDCGGSALNDLVDEAEQYGTENLDAWLDDAGRDGKPCSHGTHR
jgi:hypothetical protein